MGKKNIRGTNAASSDSIFSYFSVLFLFLFVNIISKLNVAEEG